MKQPLMTKDDFVYSRIGMALVSMQRVEFLTGNLLELLSLYDKDIYGITTSEFLEQTAKSKNAIKTLGTIFRLLKLNPKLVVEDELNDYLKKRNLFVHSFYSEYLKDKSDQTSKRAVDFCYDFGRHSDRVASFFKGLVYFLGLQHVKSHEDLDSEFKGWNKDFEYFLLSLKKKRLDNIHNIH